jgi:hypothetical protein
MSWLQVRKGGQTYNLKVVGEGQGNSPLKVRRNSVTYDVCLVDPGDSTASPVRVKTSTGVKAIQLATGYIITASVSGGYGSISPSGEVTVNQGGSQSFTITPCIGYAISAVTVDGASVGAVSTYQFTNVQANHTIQAAFLPLYAITTAASQEAQSAHPEQP